MTIDAIGTRTNSMMNTGNLTNMTNMTNTARPSDITTSNRAMSSQRGRELFADGMDRRAAMGAGPTPQVQPTSIVSDFIGGAAGAVGSLVTGVLDAFSDGLGALARGDILGALANIPRAVINTGLGAFGLFTDVALGLFTTVFDGVLGLLRR